MATWAVFLLGEPSPTDRSAVPPEHLQGQPQVQQTCCRHSSHPCGHCPWAVAPCERSRLMIPLECLIALGDRIDWLYFVYPRVVSDSCVWSANPDLVVVPLDIPPAECHVTRHQVGPYSAHEVKRWRIPKCSLVAGDANGNVNWRGNPVSHISHEATPSAKALTPMASFCYQSVSGDTPNSKQSRL